MDVKFALLTFFVSTAECINREKFQTTPPPQKNFNVERYVGDWYIIARMPSCSWVGSYDFTNYVSQYSLRPDGVLDLTDTYRSTGCTSIVITLTPQGVPGNYEAKDPIGNVISGQNVIIATDYKTFAIKWGCNKVIGKMCQDAFLVIKSRKRQPKPYTWKIIEKILNHYFEISLTDTIRIIHDEKACVKLPEYKRYPKHMEHLKKMYRR